MVYLILGEICLTVGTPMWVVALCFGIFVLKVGYVVKNFLEGVLDTICD